MKWQHIATQGTEFYWRGGGKTREGKSGVTENAGSDLGDAYTHSISQRCAVPLPRSVRRTFHPDERKNGMGWNRGHRTQGTFFEKRIEETDGYVWSMGKKGIFLVWQGDRQMNDDAIWKSFVRGSYEKSVSCRTYSECLCTVHAMHT